jgi:hypothetical protein
MCVKTPHPSVGLIRRALARTVGKRTDPQQRSAPQTTGLREAPNNRFWHLGTSGDLRGPDKRREARVACGPESGLGHEHACRRSRSHGISTSIT